jgi:preprotein translocase subunit SecY
MKKFAAIFKNKELVNRIFFTVMVLFVLRIGAAITFRASMSPGQMLKELQQRQFALPSWTSRRRRALSNFSVFALGVSPYITAQIIIQLLSKDVLPALTELSKQGEYGRKKTEMATRYLTLLLGAVQGVRHHQDDGEQRATSNSRSARVLLDLRLYRHGAPCGRHAHDVARRPNHRERLGQRHLRHHLRRLRPQLADPDQRTPGQKWITNNVAHGPSEMVKGSLPVRPLHPCHGVHHRVRGVHRTLKRKIPVQHANKGGGQSMARASFLPIKVNSAGVIPVIFAASIMSAPSIIASFISAMPPKPNG